MLRIFVLGLIIITSPFCFNLAKAQTASERINSFNKPPEGTLLSTDWNSLLGYNQSLGRVYSGGLPLGNFVPTFLPALMQGPLGINASPDGAQLRVMSNVSGNNILALLNNSGNEVFSVLNNGNVGIGTSSPDQSLTINTTGTSSASGNIRFSKTSSIAGMGSYIQFDTSASATARGVYNSRIEGIRSSLNNGSGILAFFTTNSSQSTSALERMRISENGNIGIGTTNPATKLTINNSETYSVDAGGGRIGNVGDPGSDNKDAVNVSYLKSALTAFAPGGASSTWGLSGNNIYNTNTGNVGIGTNSPGYKLSVESDSNGLTLGLYRDSNTVGFGVGPALFLKNSASNYVMYADYFGGIEGSVAGAENGMLVFRTRRTGIITEAMRVASTGNVGIGTTNPLQQLHLTASLRLPNTTSDTTGVIYKDGNRFIHNFRHPTGDTAIPAGQNTFIGENAGNFTMGSTATGSWQSSYNTGVGRASLLSNTTGSGNSALGVNTLFSNTTGANNSALGYLALYSNTTGNNNSALGRNAGRYLADGSTGRETGNNGLYLGTNTKASANGTTNEIVIGYNAIGKGSNTATYGNTSMVSHIFEAGNVGIGTTTPGTRLTIIPSGNYSIDAAGGRIGNVGPATLDTDAVNVSYLKSALTAFAPGGASSTWGISGTNIYNTNTGNVGIGTTNPGQKLHVIGNILIPNNNSVLSRDAGNNVSVPLFKFNTSNVLEIGTWEGAYVSDTIVKGGNGNVFVDFSQGNNKSFIVRKVGGSTPTELMRVNTAGNVGIGTSNIGGKLDVRGGISYFNQNLDSQRWATAINIPINAANYIDSESAPNRGMRLLGWNSGSGSFGGGISWGMAPKSDGTWLSGSYSYGQFLLAYNSTNLQIQGSNQTTSDTPITFTPSTFLTILNNGNIGIGTTTPGTRLTVVPSGNHSIDAAGGRIGNVGPATLDTDAVNVSYLKSALTAFAPGGASSTWGISGTSIYNTNTGNVGIGISSPEQKLDVDGNIRSSETVVASSGVFNGNTYSGELTSGVPNMILYNLGSVGRFFAYDGGSYYDLAIGDWNSGNPNIMLKVGGNVGINRGSPTYKLDVAGTLRTDNGANLATVSGNVGVGTTNPLGGLNVSRNSSISNDSNVGDYQLLVSSPSDSNQSQAGLAFRISSTQNNTPGAAITHERVGAWSQGGLLFKTRPGNTSNTPLFTRMVIDKDGNVGIGATNPSHKLEISGSATNYSIDAGDKRIGNVGDPGSDNKDAVNVGYLKSTLTAFAPGGASSTWGLSGNNIYNTNTGNVGIGTSSPVTSLHVVAPAISGMEDIARFSVSDAPNSYLKINSLTSLSGSFLPAITGYNGDDNRWGSFYVANVGDLPQDGRYYPGLQFDARKRNGSELTNVPVVSFASNLNAKLTTWHDGMTKIGGVDKISTVGSGAIKPTTMLDVIGSGSEDLLNLIDETTSRFYVKKSGDVGIGTSNPGAKLHVESLGGAHSGIRLHLTNASSYAPIDFYTPSGLSGQFVTTGTSFSNGVWTGDMVALSSRLADGSLGLGAIGANGYIKFVTGGEAASNERMRITSSGNVGIGTTTPGTRLTVVPSGNHSIDAAGGRIGNVGPATLDTDAVNVSYLKSALTAFAPGGASSTWGISGTSIYNTNTGNVGIGTNSPNYPLTISTNGSPDTNTGLNIIGTGLATAIRIGGTTAMGIAGTGEMRFNGISGKGFVFTPNNDNNVGMSMLANGNVGIGTNSPGSYKLNVQGNSLISASGSNVNGVLSIQSTDTSTRGTLIRRGFYQYDSQDSSGSFYQSWGMRLNGSDNLWYRTYTSANNYLPYIQLSTGGRVVFGGATTNLATDLNPTLNPTMTIDVGSGSVGIGTTTPGTRLTVVPSGNYSIDAAGGRIGNVGNPTANTDAVNVSYLSSALTAFAPGGASSTWGISGTNIYNTNTGNVGIGTTAPSKLLTISGNNYPGVDIKETDNNINLRIEAHNVNLAGVIKTMGSHSLEFGTNNTERMIITSNGLIGIGTTNPLQQLHLTASLRLPNTTSDTTGVIYKDGNRFIHNFRHPTGDTAIPAGQNTFIGENAGNFTMGSTATETWHGSYNTGVGRASLYSNTTGYNNSALGVQALYSNTTGYNNSALGRSSLLSNTTGHSNSALGSFSLLSNTTGHSNSALGFFALRSNTTGHSNSALGYLALYSNTTGSNNSALGVNAGRYLADGSTGRETGNFGLYLGRDTKASNNGTDNEIVIGYNAIGKGSNTATYGNTSMVSHIFEAGNVGIGTTTPGTRLTIIPSGNYSIDAAGGRIGNVGPATLDTDAVNVSYLKSALTAFAPGGASSTWGVSGTSIYNTNTGNVGIGTTNPATILSVNAPLLTLNAENPILTANSGASSNQGGIYSVVDTASPFGFGLLFKTYKTNVGLFNAVKIQSDGNVGIGTTNPLQQLHLTGSIRLPNTTSDTTGVIYKDGNRFIHNFRHPTGGTVIPDGSNTFIGENAGNFTMGNTATSATHGSYNTGVGRNVLLSNTVGFNNSALGFEALFSNTTGHSNSAVGLNTLRSNTTGYSNSALGFFALRSNTTGHSNSALGVQAGSYLSDGSTGRETGNYGLYLGRETKASANGTTNEIVIGYNAIGKGSNTATYGNTSMLRHIFEAGNVGIGVINPSHKLEISGSATNYSIDAGDKRIGNVGDPIATNNKDVVNVGYLKSALSNISSEHLALTGGTLSGPLNMGGNNITNINKLTVNTIDPLYRIKGVNYSTFASAIVGGVKEEYVGRIELSNRSKNGYFEETIDFRKQQEGSDLWVWRKTVDFSKENVEVFITPYGDFAQTYYLIQDDKLIIRSDKAITASYRLVGKRIDWREWPTKAHDQEETPGFIIH